jgi:hypothetical protein
VKGIHPKTGDEEEMLKDFVAMLLSGKDDFRGTRAVEKKLNKVLFHWDTQMENPVRDWQYRSSITGGEEDEIAPL